MRRGARIFNAIFWFAAWVAVVMWTGTFRHWGAMTAEAMIPLMLWGYIHVVLRPQGTRGPADIDHRDAGPPPGTPPPGT